jgi:hypothetical protein
VTIAPDDLLQRRHLLFTMLTACAWRDTPAGPAPVVAGLRTFFGGWLGIGRVASSAWPARATTSSSPGCGEEGWRADSIAVSSHGASVTVNR